MSAPPVDPAAPITVRTLADLLAHPELLHAPASVIPYFAWRGRVTLLAGREKGGKSTLAAAGAATLSRGGYFLGEFTDCARVLWLSADSESLYDQVARFQRFGAEPTNTDLVTDWDRTPSGLFRAAGGAAVVVIDTLASFAELVAPDAGSSAAWTPIMLAIKRCANETGAAFILLHHANKVTGAYRDSTAIGAGVDVILEMTETSDEPNVRHIRARGRWHLADFTVRLVQDTFVLDDNVPSLDARVLAHVEAHPGKSGRAIRLALGGRDGDVVAALGRLEHNALIANQGTERCAEWCRTGAVVPVVPTTPEPPLEGCGARAPRSGGHGTTTTDDQLTNHSSNDRAPPSGEDEATAAERAAEREGA